MPGIPDKIKTSLVRYTNFGHEKRRLSAVFYAFVVDCAVISAIVFAVSSVLFYGHKLVTRVLYRRFYRAFVYVSVINDCPIAGKIDFRGKTEIFKRGLHAFFAVFAHHSFDVYRNFIAVCGL